MEKLKIIGMSSEEYPGGRIDEYSVQLDDKNTPSSQVIALFRDLNFPEKTIIEKLDVIYWERGDIFIYGSKEIKAWLLAEEDLLSIKFDTSLTREEINKAVERYFEFPKEK
ncbi:MAG: hypothetical protein KKC19_03460 [Nanoarchaeota archaeon]|nr:hypothetical protein [Nanoarchaeota archaeon]